MKSFSLLLSIFSVATLSLCVTTVKADSQSLYNNSYGVPHYTRYDMEQMLKPSNLAKHQEPSVSDVNDIKDIPAAKDQNGEPLEVWDSWPLKTADGQLANFKGYYVTFALTGNRNVTGFGLSSNITVFYQKISDSKKGIDSWKSAGNLLNSNTEGAINNIDFQDEIGEWSGSAFLKKDSMIRTYYTSFRNQDPTQSLATFLSKINKTKTGLVVDHSQTQDRKIIFSGDNKYYETYAQMMSNPDRTPNDDHCLRDPYYVQDHGHRYLVFEANTGPQSGPAGPASLYNQANLGGDSAFQQSQLNLFQNDSKIATASEYDNAAIGLIELDNNNNVKKVFKPLMVFNAVDDETERPVIVKSQKRWYLFTAMHGWHLDSPNVNPDDSYWLGFSSKQITNGYQKMNGNGLVLYSDRTKANRDYNYSFNTFQTTKNPFIITSYANDIGNATTGHATFAPSMMMDIKGNQATIRNKLLPQGQLVK